MPAPGRHSPNPRRQPSQRPGAIAALASAISMAAVLAGVSSPASAQHIENGRAVFAALDKVTARISKLEAKIGETVKFGALRVTARACYTREPTEPPKTSTFVEIDETQLDGKARRIFTGWMFAEHPGLNAVEHPVYDVWLTDCGSPRRPAVATAPSGNAAATAGDAQNAPPLQRRARPRR